jgi:hypothetical protein
MRHHHMKADSFWLKVGCVFLGLALFIGQLWNFDILNNIVIGLYCVCY